MNKINIDTKEIKDCGNHMIDLVDRFAIISENIFNKLENVNSNTVEQQSCWVGNSANKFVQYVKVEKEQYNVFLETLKKEANFLVDMSDSVSKKTIELKDEYL